MKRIISEKSSSPVNVGGISMDDGLTGNLVREP